MLTNLGYGTAFLVSILVRWPLIGVAMGFLTGDGTSWRQDPDLRRVYAAASWIWVGLFYSRLIVQTPMYLAGWVEVQGIVKIIMGYPLFLAAAYFTYRVLQPVFRRKREEKARAKDAQKKPRTFVLDFKGDLRATAVASLREEVSAVLRVAQPGDDVLLKLENPGGTVHEHGLAASQLLRLKHRGLRLTIVVDKVAASGGYLMACVGDRLVAAPFAIIGSIGVVAQLPNFHRLLDQKGIDFEQITAGRFKRTLTMFGRNTDEGREKLREEVEDVHELFKAQIREYRPQVDLDRAAGGIAAVFNDISAPHRAYFDAGGLGILAGDGKLPHYGSEDVLEAYYSATLADFLALSVDYQFMANPAYNRDRGPVSIFGGRIHAAF